MRRTRFLSAIFPTLAAFACAVSASLPALAADAYPNKPIHLIVPYAAGGTTDQIARSVQQPLEEILGQTIIIENKPGAGGALGTAYVAKSAPDGYTLVFGNSGPNAIIQLIRPVPYDEFKDLRSISTVVFTPMILAVPTDSPIRTPKEFIAAARKAGNWNFGSVGIGSLSHLTGEYFSDLAELHMTNIPYNGGAPMMTAFAGGQINAAFVTGLDGAAMMQGGKIRYIAVATPQRTDVLPGLPALAEDVPGFASTSWFGVLAPKATPDDIVAKLHDAIVKAAARPELKKFFATRNVETRSSTPEELDRIIRGEMQQWGAVVRKANIKAE